MTPGKKFSIEECIAVCEEYCKNWQNFFKVFSEGLEHKKIYQNEEIEFQKIMHKLASNHFRFAMMAGERFKDPERILEVLSESVSLSHLKNMTEAQFSYLQINWHSLFIEMNKTLGKMRILLPPSAEVS